MDGLILKVITAALVTIGVLVYKFPELLEMLLAKNVQEITKNKGKIEKMPIDTLGMHIWIIVGVVVLAVALLKI